MKIISYFPNHKTNNYTVSNNFCKIIYFNYYITKNEILILIFID